MASPDTAGITPILDPIFGKNTEGRSEFFQSKDLLLEGSNSSQAVMTTQDEQRTANGNWAATFSVMRARPDYSTNPKSGSPKAKSMGTTAIWGTTNNNQMRGGARSQETNRREKKNGYRELTKMFNSLDITVARNTEKKSLPPLLQPNSRAALTGDFKFGSWKKEPKTVVVESAKPTVENWTGFRRLLRAERGLKGKEEETGLSDGTDWHGGIRVKGSMRSGDTRQESSSSQQRNRKSPLDSEFGGWVAVSIVCCDTKCTAALPD